MMDALNEYRRCFIYLMPIPSGTVTFLFTDLEGSTKLWEQYPEAMQSGIARLEALSRHAIESHRGYVVKAMGDGFMASFADAQDAVRAAIVLQLNAQSESWVGLPALRIRAAIHTGVVEERAGDYYGSPVNRTARLMGVGYGGQILLSETAYDLVRDSVVGDIVFRDLGQHRLRDMVRPERIFQANAPDLLSDFPPLKTLDVLPNNLPNLLTTFVGREHEKEKIKAILNNSRLLTLTGAGGTGKTRLSIEAAADSLEQFPDGVWLVEYAAVTDATLVAQTIATTLHLREERPRPILATLQDYLANKNVLLILDNCEHLVLAIAQAADVLLRTCAQLKILASSREPLGIPGEKTLRVPSLAVPSRDEMPALDQLTQFEAIKLFVDRATNLQPSFVLTKQNASAVAQIVRRLDGIPLAIELGAARIKALPVDKIAARLDDQFNLLSMGSRTLLPRQQTLNALIEWSFNLLTEAERVLFRRLSVLVGGWTFEAAEAICAGNGVEGYEILNLLSELVEKSLVNVREDERVETRYYFLDTIRQYARVKLLESGEEGELRLQHCEWFLGLTEDAEANFHGPDQSTWLNRLEIEYDNISFALDWLVTTGDAERGLRLSGALYDYWNIRGHWSEGRERLNKILALPASADPSNHRANALRAAGNLARQQNDYAVAQSLYESSLEISKALGDELGTANALNGLGSNYEAQGNYSSARDSFLQALDVYHRVNSPIDQARATLNLGLLESNHGNFAQAEIYFAECLPTFRELGDRRLEGMIVGNLGLMAYYRGDYAKARAFCGESLAIRRELKDKFGIANQLNNLASVALRLKEYANAKKLFEESLTLFAEIKSKRMIADVFSMMASVAVAQQNPLQAGRLLGAAKTLLDGMRVPLNEANRIEFERSVDAAKALDPKGFDVAWAEGNAMSLEEAVVAALGEPRN